MTDTTEISDEELTELLACRKRRAIPFDLKGTIDGLVARLSRVERERDALKERVERMEAALEPFDCVARLIEMQKARGTFVRDDDEPFTSGVAWTSGGKKRTLTWGDFRRAREALAGKAASAAQGGNDE